MRKSFMKIPFAVFTAAVLIFSFCMPRSFSAKAEEETPTITVYSWEDYIDEGDEEAEEEYLQTSILDIFEEQEGIHVEYYTFATNEEMYNELIKNPDGCDLVCPSEYMIMKMKEEGLIKPYAAPENWAEFGSPYIKDVFEELGLAGDEETYAVGYMWGTMGYLFNADKFTAEDLSSWSSIWDKQFNGRTTIKDSIRDTYIMAVAVVYEEELLARKADFESGVIDEEQYKAEIFSIFNRSDRGTIEQVEAKLLELRPHLYGFEVDSGKSDILTGKIDVNFAWSGDAVYSMDEGDDAGVNLEYVVPNEGSNVWFDGFVMPNNAQTDLALKFLNFLCDPEIAIRNMEYIGYTSAIAGEDILNWLIEGYELLDAEGYAALSEEEQEDYFAADLSYFFGEETVLYTDTVGRQFSAQYPDYDVIVRCAVMDNFDKDTLVLINAMWNRIKLITLSDAGIIILSSLIILAVCGTVAFKFKDKLFRKKSKDGEIGENPAKPQKYKLISREPV